MSMFRVKCLLIAAVCTALLLVAGSSPSYATCAGGISIALTKPNGQAFTNCGQSAVGLFWLHHRGVYNSNTLGIDSGNTYPNANADPVPGIWRFAGDWGNSGVNDCPQGKNLEGGSTGNLCVGACDISGQRCNPQLAAADCNAALGDTACIGIEDLAATDFVIAGKDPANPFQARALFGSVDLNECSQAYALDSLGAPAGNGDACGAAVPGSDCNQVGPQFSCALVPFPTIIGVTQGTNQTTFDVSLPGQNVPYLDDCNVAESKAVNCPRLLNAGRVLMYRRGDCAAPPAGDLLLSTAPAVRLWHPVNSTDTDYNGNTGTSGATPNPITLGSGPNPIQNANRVDQAPHVVRIVVSNGPAFCVTNTTGAVSATACSADAGCVTAGTSCGIGKGRCMNPANGQMGTAVCCTGGANCTTAIPCSGTFSLCAQCLYLGLGAAGDSSPDAGSTQGIAPFISVNAANPIHLEAATAPSATPATDRVVNLVAAKTGGKASVSWDTSAELSTSGFKVMGQRRQGGTFQIGPSFIEATGKTDGQSHHYSVDLSGSDLKGASKIYVVVVHPTGPDDTFGPANL